jgi:hypothetical protein
MNAPKNMSSIHTDPPIAQDTNIMTRMLAMKVTLMRCYDMLDALSIKTPYEIKLMDEIRDHLPVSNFDGDLSVPTEPTQ